MRSLFWALLNALQAVYLVVCTSFWIFAALIVRLLTRDTHRPLMMAHRYWSRTLLWVGKIGIETVGVDKIDFSRSYFYASNHQSMLDIPLLYRVLPTPLIFILKEELRRIPVLGWYIQAMGMILVPRRERLRSVKNLEECRQRMAEGKSILMFPEGTRSRDGQVLDFKPGVFVPAIDLQAEIIPVAIVGSGEVIPADTFRVRPGHVRVVIGQPISTHGLTRDDRRELAQRVRTAVVALKDR